VQPRAYGAWFRYAKKQANWPKGVLERL